MRFWLRPVEIEKSAEGTVGGIRLERAVLGKEFVEELTPGRIGKRSEDLFVHVRHNR